LLAFKEVIILKINVSKLLKSDLDSLKIEYKSFENELSGLDVKILKDSYFEGILNNVEDILILNGNLHLKYNVECFRCLKSLVRELEIKVNESFCEDINEDDSIFYEIKDENINIKKVIIDNIILNLPMKEYCKEDCKGLCQKCGAVIDDGTCKCKEEDYINPQFEILKRIK
jgi:uncharacterized protein